mmetsp:Transcript_6805/g.16449  ORF Transcript_6805/g.16449 Transcript_6805/m.16449 type:complete len:284 (+) Transcript_6805:233-1084(+)
MMGSHTEGGNSTPPGRRGRRPSKLRVTMTNVLSSTPPLRPVQSLFDTDYTPVIVRLDEAVYPTVQEDLVGLQGDVASIATICAQMSFLIEKETLLDDEVRHDNLADLVREHLNKLYEQLHVECHNYMPDVSIHEVLYSTGLGFLFPSVVDRLQLERRACQGKVVTFQEYLSHMAQLNQAFSMSQQLRDDCSNNNHKYIAHQIALLYQCLSYQNLRTQQFKKRIEPEFEDLKRTTEQAAQPQLTPKQREWLRSLTTDVMEVATDFNGPVTAFLHSWVDVLAHTG